MTVLKSSSQSYTHDATVPPQETQQGLKLQEVDVLERFGEEGFGKIYVGTDKLLYFLDSDGVLWPIATGGAAAQYTTLLEVTDTIISGTNYDVTANLPNVTKSGDDGDLRADAATFNAEEAVLIFVNGNRQRKSSDVVWVSASLFQLNLELYSGDEIVILS